MHRALALPIVITLAACSPAARPPTSPEAMAPVAVDVRVTSAEDKPAVLLAGHLDLAPRRAAQLEHRGARAPESERLRVEALPRDDGLYRVELDWSETSADNRRVSFVAALVVKRGASTAQRMDWPGGGRVVELSLK